MSKRKKSPNMMDSFLGGNKVPASSSPATNKGRPPSEVVKVKNTYHLSLEVSEQLEMAKSTLRGMVDVSKRGAVSKSLIIEAALLLALDELEQEGGSSRIAKKLDSLLF